MTTKKRMLVTCLMLPIFLGMKGQATDKADADQIVFQVLSANHDIENWHPELTVVESELEETAEKGVYIMRGDSFQVKSLRSDIYLWQKNRQWQPLYDTRYPVESFVNLLLNRITDNRHLLELNHHQYGGKVPKIVLPMQTLYDILARPMRLYCNITSVNADEIRAVLVFHNQRLDFIHMLEIRVATKALFDPESIISADLYTNIPQGNVRNIFTERKH